MEFLNRTQTIKAINLIRQAGAKLDERVHQVACSGLAHYAENADTTALSLLVKAMPKSGRTNALKYWITQHANVRWDSKAGPDKTGFYVKAVAGAEVIVDLDHAIEHPFWEKKDTEQSVFNAESRVKSFITAFTKAVMEGKISKEDAKKAQEAVDAGFASITA
jgi:hypothetical protein